MVSRNSLPWLVISAVLLALLGGCCACRCPRIDPSGERCFIWPDEQPTVSNPFAPAAVGPSSTNPVAPPVYSDTAAPGTFVPPAAIPAVAAPGAAPVVSPTNVVGTTVAGSGTGPQDTLTLNPNRVLAPVGSEVILRAGVCSSSGYYIVNQRVEWMIDRAGPGQIVTVGERGQLDMFRCPQNTPRKVDNWYAIGATIPYHVCLDRGTADPADDLQIRPGEAWVSVSSATEGTSYVTAYSPAVGNWPGRTARATIVWVDAQWQFPPSVTIPAGQSHTLTTTVTRQSDGAPVAGYIVRYEVVGGGRATVGYDAGQASEVTTDSQGRARVEITPTDAAPGSTTVNIQVIRAEQPGAAGGARVTLGSGATTINWAGVGASPIPQLQAGQVPPPASQPTQPLPFVPPPPEPAVPPLGATTPGKPQLEVKVTRDTADPIAVGQNVRFIVTVRNTGTAPARNIVVASSFDSGLSHSQAVGGATRVEYKGMKELAAGESDSVPLTFTVTKPGRQCQRVTVSAEGATDAFDQGCVDIAAPAAAVRPTLRVEMTGDRTKSVGETSIFNSVVENTGTVPAKNLTIEMPYDAEFLEPVQATEGYQMPASNPFRWTIPQLAPGERRNFAIEARCRAATDRAGVRLLVRGDDDINYADEHFIEIRPAIGPGATGAAGSGNLRLSLIETANNAQVGDTKPFYVYLDNIGVASERDVSVAVLIPPNFTVDTTAVQPRGSFQVENRPEGMELRFTPIAELRPNEQQRYMIPLTPARAGAATVMAQVKSQQSPTPTTQKREISILPR